MRSAETQRLVYEVVRDAAKCQHRATVSEVAKATGISRSSVYRSAKQLGYDTWLDFTTGLVRYYDDKRTDDPVATSIEAIAQALLRNVDRPILVDAVGDAEICESYLLYRLGETGFSPLPFANSTAQLRGGKRESGIAFVINESGMSLLPTCVAARENGFEVISITSSHDTPISKISSINVVIKNNKSSLDAYEPNYFAARCMAFLARLFQHLSKELSPSGVEPRA